ncbi:hypothetical protein [Pelagibius sp. Alg239-R121]|uniref:hypothetical protein n=1 Tax=Pelagibius sp. Alg239-R121 TaxID=2993448 RepID=UPI0024A6E38F|nr:hypothetical protein [Pelagibius sp. Alg239-R121]
MGKIEQHILDDSARKKALGQFSSAKILINYSPVAFGESHASVIARAIVWDLMDTGCVKRLFTEQANSQLGERTLEDRLQTLAKPKISEEGNISYTGGGTESELSDPIEELYLAREALNEISGREKPDITYMSLMQHAVHCGVSVYCYDVKISKDRLPGGRRRYPRLTDSEVLAMRNEHMTTKYLNTPNRTEAGTVLLGGSDHFDEHSRPTLLETMKIPEMSYIRCD